MDDIDQVIKCFQNIAEPDVLVEQNDGFAIHALRFRQAQAAEGLKIAERLKGEMTLSKVFGPKKGVRGRLGVVSANKMTRQQFFGHLTANHLVQAVNYDGVHISHFDYESQLNWHADDHFENEEQDHVHADD